LKVLHEVSILVYGLGTRIAKDVHPTMLAEIVKKRIGDDVVSFRKIVVQAAVEHGDLFGRDRGKVIAQFVNQ
jgi:hypothetical protein